MSILIKNAEVYTKSGILKDHAVCIRNDKISAVTDCPEEIERFIRENKDSLEILDGRGKLVMPGLINTHTHSPMTVLRNIGSDLPLEQWLFGEIIPREDRLTPKDVYYASLLGQIEMIRSGTVCFNDMYEPFETLAEAVSASGLKVLLSVPVLQSCACPDGSFITKPCTEEASRMLSRWNGAENGRIHVLCEIHSIYLYDYRKLPEAVAFAKEHALGIHMHLHETEKEIADSIEATGMRPAAYFESIGAFDLPVIAAHCTHLTEEEIQLLRRKDVCVSVNLTSNLKLASGIPPLPELLQAGVRVGFGTDGCASNNNLNLFEEMHLAGILYKGMRKDPGIVSPRQVIDAATCGREIRKDAAADLILIDMSAPHLNPVNDPEAAIVYSMQASDVDTVIVQGKILMRNRMIPHLDEEKIIYEVNHVKL